MDAARSRMRMGLVLGMGVALGWLASGFHASPMQAGSGDRSGESIVATGPVLLQYDDATKSPIALDALYFLDYKGGRLFATVPSYQSEGAKMHILGVFAERDLVADFRLDLNGGPRPRFLMTTGALGRYTDGWAPLYVIETTTGQVGVYRLQVGQRYGTNGQPQFDLVELRPYLKAQGTAPKAGGLPGLP